MTDQRPWLANYPQGIPANIDADAYPNLVAMLDETFQKYRKQTAFYCMGGSITYDQWDKMSRQFGAYLQSRGLSVGDKIALMMPNLLQYPIALVGALRAGLIVVNTNPLYKKKEMLHQFTDSDVKAIVIAENFAAELEKVLPQTNIKTTIVTSLGEMLGFFKGNLVNFVVRTVKGMVPKFNIPNTVNFKEALSQGKKFTLQEHHGNSDDTILHQYTGGTTGVAKGAMLTNRNLIANMLQVRAWMMPFLKEQQEVALSPLPMYHIYAFTVNVLVLSSIGSKTVLVVNPRDLSSINKEFKTHKITLMTGVNTLFNGLLNNEEFRQLDFSSFKVTSAGGMAVQRKVAEEWQRVTGCAISEGYGMTESSPVATTNPLDSTNRIGTIGLPIPSTTLRIVDEQGNPLPQGEVGEIQIKGPQVMKGYYNRPEETANTLRDGWLSTGDIGQMDADGYFKIVDRKKDMILVSGFNVYPNDVEDTVAHHPKVLEVAAIGVPDDNSGEAVKVFVVKKDKSLTDKELIAWCKEEMTGYKRPKQVEFRDELPKSNVGKILRRVLRDEEMAKG